MAKNRGSKIDPALVKAISKLLKETMGKNEASLLDKMRVIDRALQLEKIKAASADPQWGKAFLDEDPDDKPTGEDNADEHG